MKTISLISQKGGSGKTTIAVHLAVCAEINKKRTAIIDCDPQGSAIEWQSRRESHTPEVIAATIEKLQALLKQAKDNKAELAIIDTAPHSDRMAALVASASDIILIPCRPYVFDMAAIVSTLTMLDLVKARDKASILFNASPIRGGFADEAERELPLPCVPVRLSQRVAYAHAINSGSSVEEYEPKGKASHEIRDLYTWLTQRRI